MDVNYRYTRDDLIPMLRDDGVVATISPFLKDNPSREFLIELIQMNHGVCLLPQQLNALISDLRNVGDLDGAAISGDDFKEPTTRAVSPPGLGCSSANVWITPLVNPYKIRWYVNGKFKLEMSDYNESEPATLGATTGNIIQVCQVVDGTPGWWARIAVP